MNDGIEKLPERLPVRSHGVIAGRVMNDKGTLGKTGERIAKAIARAGLTSRREAEAWIAGGRVAVNGAVIRSPALNVSAHDRVTVDGDPLPARERTRLFLYHKPRGLMTSHADPRGRPTIFQHLPKDLPRLISVGRLDFNTEGLILLTNDGALARILELPSTGWLRRYRVRAHGSVTQAKLDELRTGLTIDGIHYRQIEATLDRVQASNLWLTFAIREGKNREVRNVLGHLGLTVTRLIRVSFGPFQLAELAEGAVEEVRTRVLREQLGERVAAASGADFSAPIVSHAGAPDALTPQPEETRPAKDERPPRRSHRPLRLTPNKPAVAPLGDGVGETEMRRTSRSKQAPASHAWRAREEERPPKKLRRKFHGARRNDERSRERSKEGSTDEARAGLVADRKGRRVLVERLGRPRPPEQPKRGGPKRGRDGRRFARDRPSGGRHPRSRGR
jgi:23S rRNA pseudouridine2605 synthase